MRNDGFGAFELGARLRKLRVRAQLTQDEVADRMGLTYPMRKMTVMLLETGRTANPTVQTLGRFLRACGAQFFEFYDTLTLIEPVPVDTRPIERTPMKCEQKEMLLRRVKREVYNYQDETSYPKRGKPSVRGHDPEAKRFGSCPQRRAKLADYRVQVALVEQDVKKLLGTENVTFVEVTGHLTVARRILGELRRAVRGHAASGDTIPNRSDSGHVPSWSCPRPESSPKLSSAADYVKRNRLNPELVERVRKLVIEQYRR
jgi:transcriptional regulator with XRE-family HTH domain